MPVFQEFAEGKDTPVGTGMSKTLYKYRTFSDRHLDILRLKQIHFSRPDSFNDPFDCVIPIRYDLLKPNEFDNLAIQALLKSPETRGIPTVEVLRSFYTKGVHDVSKKFYQEKEKMVQAQLDEILAGITVFCLSETNDNILMWSHYSYNHTGMCIGFDRDQLYYNTGVLIGKIRYCEEFPVIIPDDPELFWPAIQVLSKAKNWEYEREVRFVNLYHNRSAFDISPNAIREIILGCKVDQDDRAMLIDMITKDETLIHVKIFQAHIVSNNFRLELLPVK